MLLARRGVRKIANAAHDTADAVGGYGVFIRTDEREERLRVLRHAWFHRHPDDVRIIEVAVHTRAGKEFAEVGDQVGRRHSYAGLRVRGKGAGSKLPQS